MKFSLCSRFLVLALSLYGSALVHADTLSTIRETGVFKLGHRESSAPFSFINEKGQVQGYSVELCLRLFEQIKTELKMPDLKVTYVPLKPADRISAVKDGKADVECGSTTNNPARQKEVAFSLTTFIAGARLMGKKDSGFRDFGALKGKSIAVTEKTTTETIVRQFNRDRAMNMNLVVVKDHAEGFAKLVNGEVDVVANDDALLAGLAIKAKDPAAYDFIGKFLSIEPYGIMYRRNDPAFEKVVDRVLGDLFYSGEQKKIYAKWFEENEFKLPMNQYMRESVRIPNRFGGY